MSANKITAADVADRAGVSISAVSRVFTPGGSASSKMTEKVMQAANQLGYRPNLLARSLSTGRTRMIGLVVAYLYNQYYAEVLEKLSVALQAQGYHVLVFIVPRTSDTIEPIVEDLLRHRVDGLVVASVAMTSQLAERCTEAGVPILLFNRIEDHQSFSAVTSDNVGGGRQVADLLLRLGHTKLGYIAGWEGASTQRDREAGFVTRLAESGIALAARAVGNFMRDDAAAAARQMFSGPDRPSAVFVANDFMAFAVMDVLRFELGLRVPQDVSVVGYGDVMLAQWPVYDLTTVRQPTDIMVARAVTMLLNMLEHDSANANSVVLDGTLIERGSTAHYKGHAQ